MKSTILITILLAACGGGGGGGGNTDGNGSGSGQMDAPPNVPAMITISGTASARSTGAPTPVAGVVVEAHKVSDDSLVTMATTDAQGNYTMTITTNGQPLDGYLKATKTGYVATYLYPPAPLAMDFSMASINMVTPTNFGLLSTLAQGNQMDTNGLIALIVEDATAMPVAGATVSSSPAGTSSKYDGSNGFPSSTATSTGADGVGYVFNVPPGATTVSAMKSGSTFKSHAVKSYAMSLTTTLVTP